METFEAELKRALSSPVPLPPSELAGLNRQISQSYARRRRQTGYVTYVYLALDLVAMIVLFALFFYTSDLKFCILYAIGLLICFESTVLMKLWYWVVHSKISTMRELKLLQLQVNQLAHGQPPPIAAAAEVLAIPEGTVKSRLFHARQQLRQWMEH